MPSLARKSGECYWVGSRPRTSVNDVGFLLSPGRVRYVRDEGLMYSKALSTSSRPVLNFKTQKRYKTSKK
eukprot:6491362-Amphidinium_carterae.2